MSMLGKQVFVAVRDRNDKWLAQPATVVRDWGECVNLKVDLDGGNVAIDASNNAVMTSWLTSVSLNSSSNGEGVVSCYFLHEQAAVMAAAAANAKAAAAPVPTPAPAIEVPGTPASS